MSRHFPWAQPLRSISIVLVAVGLLSGCGAQDSPASPTDTPSSVRSNALAISGFVYRQPSSVGEPPVAAARITLRDATGAERTALTDDRGYYSIEATPGTVIISAAKEGFETRESRFDVAESTVLNFGLEPMP